MKLLQTIILTIACLASYPVFAQSDKPAERTSATQRQEIPNAIEITASGNRIKIANAPVDSIVEIYSVVGIKVEEIKIKQPTAEYTLRIAKGYYIVRINDTVRKIAIR